MSNQLPHRRNSLRLSGYDYAQPGAYFITLVTHQRASIFGEIREDVARLNPCGLIVEHVLLNLPTHFPVEVAEYVVMPNHLHAIIWLLPVESPVVDGRSYGMASTPNGTKPNTLGSVVQNLKSTSSRRINQLMKTPGVQVWQRNYYDRVLRNEQEIERAADYILDNPIHWQKDPNWVG